MATVPNQKVVTVIKHKCDKNNLYSTINLQVKREAAQNLDAGAFKLWNYFADNQSYYTFGLSRTAIENAYGIKKRQYDNGIQELIEKGYLVKVEGTNNQYNFYEAPWLENNKSATWQQKDTTEQSNENATQCSKDTTSQQHFVTTPQCSKDTRNNTYNTTYNNTKSAGSPQTSSEIPKEKESKIDISKLPTVKKEEVMSAVEGRYIKQDKLEVVYDTIKQKMYKIV